MLIMRYNDDATTYEVEFDRISDTVIRLYGSFPVRKCGFSLSRPDRKDAWEYDDFTTVFHEYEKGIEFSSDGSIYIEPEEVKHPDPTEEELLVIETQKRLLEIQSKINKIKEQIKDTDYQIIKSYEYNLVGKTSDYDITKLHLERQSLRDRINELETELSENIS